MAATDEAPEWVLTGLVTLSCLPSWWSNRDFNVSYAGYRFPRDHSTRGQGLSPHGGAVVAVLIPYG
jgi:hypothetical protein